MPEEIPYPTSQQITHAIAVRYAESDNAAAHVVAAREASLLCDTQGEPLHQLG